jgi:hypothetical protein
LMSIFQSALQEAARSSPISKNIAALVSVNVLTSQTGVLSVNAARYSLLADIRDVDPPSSVRGGDASRTIDPSLDHPFKGERSMNSTTT